MFQSMFNSLILCGKRQRHLLFGNSFIRNRSVALLLVQFDLWSYIADHVPKDFSLKLSFGKTRGETSAYGKFLVLQPRCHLVLLNFLVCSRLTFLKSGKKKTFIVNQLKVLCSASLIFHFTKAVWI